MAGFTSGRKQFNVNKNIESQELNFYPRVSIHNRYKSEVSLRSSFPNNSYLNQLKEILDKQNQRIGELKNQLSMPDSQASLSPNPPRPQQVANSSIFDPEKQTQFYKNNYKELQDQIVERNTQKLSEVKYREREMKSRIHELYSLRELEVKEKAAKHAIAEGYRKDLETQQYLLDRIQEKEEEEVKTIRSSRQIGLRRIGDYKSQSMINLPAITHEQVCPKFKNFNRLAVDYSNLAAFKQPVYTKNSPKIVKSFPVIGTRPTQDYFEGAYAYQR